MKRPATAWVILALTAVSLATAAVLPDDDWPLRAIIFVGAALLLATACGALIALRRPDNNVGWVLLAIGLSIASGLAATQWANRALVDAPGSLPGGLVAAWLQAWLWTPLPSLFALLILCFPSGHVVSPRWRLVGWVALIANAAIFLDSAFRPGFDTFPSVPNPLGSPLFGQHGPLRFLAGAAAAWLATIPLGVVSLFLRYRRSGRAERQQIKWFFFATIAAIAFVLSDVALFNLFGYSVFVPGLNLALGLVMPVLGFVLLPMSIAIAILRHGLFDIDRIISRTVSYALITLLLGGIFATVVLVPTAIVGSGNDVPDYLIAAATLVVFALFRPVRRRVQSAIDHRFNRTRYDAERTVEDFGLRLRQHIDIDALGTELCEVVNTTMQPSRVSLWLPGTP